MNIRSKLTGAIYEVVRNNGITTHIRTKQGNVFMSILTSDIAKDFEAVND